MTGAGASREIYHGPNDAIKNETPDRNEEII